MTPTLSLAICTHNPKVDVLERTLRSLQKQTLPLDQWELLLVDNASTNNVVETVNLAWHPHARVVQETRIGLTMARLRGIQEAKAELILFVDDDNELAPDYLNNLVQIAAKHSILGVIGAGRIIPEFEESPDPRLLPYTPMLALREVAESYWSNDPKDGTLPWGAGMAVRREVADRYHAMILADPDKQRLDRAGNTLNSCGDDEFSWVACEMGFGKGIFTELSLVHLIGRSRVQKEYLLRLAEGHAFSRSLLAHLHGRKVHTPMPVPSLGRMLGKLVKLRMSEAFHEGSRWLNARSLNSIDLEFDGVKRAGIHRFLRTIHG
ncbi:MAG TPA: glycosyltransferase [Flavobacteriales bacterium]|nr:glycosyltransferase [Flavobacteriales bacterium]